MSLLVWACIVGAWGAAFIGLKQMRRDRAEKRHQDRLNVMRKTIAYPSGEGTA